MHPFWLILGLFAASAFAKCGVTREYEEKLLAAHEEARRLDDVPEFPRSPDWGSIRIHIEYLDMTLFSKSDRTRLQTVIMPSVVAWYSKVLSVKRLTSNWVLPQQSCANLLVPEEHVSPGLPDTDLVVYVSTAIDIKGNWVFRSGSCAFDGATLGNPIAGIFEFNVLNYPPAYINTANEIAAGRHAFAHILAFNSALFLRFHDSAGHLLNEPLVNLTRRDSKVIELHTDKVAEMSRKYFSCNDLEGMELENDSCEGCVSSHWEKRVMEDDFMIDEVMNIADPFYSSISLAVFEDSGWYKVNYTYADRAWWGRGKGCDFFKKKCVINGVAQFDEFCDAEGFSCTNHHTKISYCNMHNYTNETKIPNQFQYFSDPNIGGDNSLLDYCPFQKNYLNGDCTGRSKYQGYNSIVGGGKVCENCRCILGTVQRAILDFKADYSPNCHEVKCEGGVATLTVGDTPVTCPPAGGRVSNITGFNGYIDCPPYEDICTLHSCPNACFGYGLCSNGICKCDDGYSGLDCSIVCDLTCKTCKTKSTCTSCYDYASLSLGACSCDLGYSFNAETNRCDRVCDATCLDCTGPKIDQCISCGPKAALTNSQCICNPGFLRSEDQKDCVACHGSCASCSGLSDSQCTGCNDNAALPAGKNSGKCACASGFYMAKNFVCNKCHGSCKECFDGTSNSCTACFSPASNFSLLTNSCVCAAGYFLSLEVCAVCDPRCQACLGPGISHCTSCPLGSVLTPEAGPGTCDCEFGLTFIPGKGCIDCDDTCLTCKGTGSNECLSCKTGYLAASGECKCGDICEGVGNGGSDVCQELSKAPIFRLKLNSLSSNLQDSVAGLKVQSGSSLDSDSSDPVPYFLQGWLFDGLDDYLVLPPNLADPSKSVLVGSTHSMEFWIRPQHQGNVTCLASKFLSTAEGWKSMLKFCIDEKDRLLLEFLVTNSTNGEKLIKSIRGGTVPTSRDWTSVGYEIVVSLNMSVSANIFVQKTVVSSDSFNGLFCDSSGSTKFIVGASMAGDNSFSNYFKGNIAEISMYHSALPLTSSQCNCSPCTTSGLCLSPCFADEYYSLLQCQKCLGNCAHGCVRGNDCLMNLDPLCEKFMDFDSCTTCIQLAEKTTSGCQCTSHAELKNSICVCSSGFQSLNNMCVKCKGYFAPSQVSAYFNSQYAKLIVEFAKPVFTASVPTCAHVFQLDVLQKLGNGYSCEWASSSKVLEVTLGTNSTLRNETLVLNFQNLYSGDDSCDNYAAPLAPIIAYKYPPPTIIAKVTAPQTFSVTCSASQTLDFDASDTIKDKRRDLTFTWRITSNPVLSSLAAYENYTTSSPFLRIAKGALSDSTLSLTVIARDTFGSESSVSKVIRVYKDSAIPLEIEGGDTISMLAVEERVVRVIPKTLCSVTNTLTYEWSFVKSTPATTPSFPFLVSTANTILVPAKSLSPGFVYTFQAKSMNGDAVGSVIFSITALSSPLRLALDRTSMDVSMTTDFTISAEATIDPDDSDGDLQYAWTCEEDGVVCSGADGQPAISGETGARLTIPASKMRENAAWNVTVTVAKDTRRASESVILTFKRKTTSDFRVLTHLPARVDPQKPLKLAFAVSASPESDLQWTQVAGSYVRLLTPQNNAYIVIEGNAMKGGAQYGFSLTVVNTDGESSAQIFFTTNSPPIPGTASISPTVGVALQTSFTQTCAGWDDPEGDYPLAYYLTYTLGSQDVALGRKSLSSVRELTLGAGEYRFTVHIFDSIGSETKFALPAVTVAKQKRRLQHSSVLQSFRSSILDSDKTYEMTIAYALTYEFEKPTFDAVLSALETFEKQLIFVDSTDVDSIIACAQTLFLQKVHMNFASLEEILRILQDAISRYGDLFTVQIDSLIFTLGQYPGTSDEEWTMLNSFGAKAIQTAVYEALPDQKASVYFNDKLGFYFRRVKGDTLNGLRCFASQGSVSFPEGFVKSLGLTTNDVFDVWVNPVLFDNRPSAQVEISVSASGKIANFSFKSASAPIKLSIENLPTPITVLLKMASVGENAKYVCSMKDAAGQWTSQKCRLVSISNGEAECSVPSLSIVQVSDEALTMVNFSNCDPNYAPIAIVVALAVAGAILVVLLLLCFKNKSNSAQVHNYPEGFVLKELSTPTDRSNSEDGAPLHPDIKTTSFWHIFRESHCVLGQFYLRNYLKRWMKAAILFTTLIAEMAVVGVQYQQDADRDSHSNSEIWSKYDVSDLNFALIALAVGFGIDSVLLTLFSAAEQADTRSTKGILAVACITAAVVCLLAVGSAVYKALEICFEAGGRWAINFLVLLLGEVLVCQSLAAAGRAVYLGMWRNSPISEVSH